MRPARTRRLVAIAGVAWLWSVTQPGNAQPATLASSIGVYVFPAGDQTETEQSVDEAECYRWAIDQTGSDPFELVRLSERAAVEAERSAARADQAGPGSPAAGAISGAARGALIGRVFGSRRSSRDAARVGAIIGGIAGGTQRQRSTERAQDLAAQAAGRAESAETRLNDFRSAFSACLEAHKYIARF